MSDHLFLLKVHAWWATCLRLRKVVQGASCSCANHHLLYPVAFLMAAAHPMTQEAKMASGASTKTDQPGQDGFLKSPFREAFDPEGRAFCRECGHSGVALCGWCTTPSLQPVSPALGSVFKHTGSTAFPENHFSNIVLDPSLRTSVLMM